MTKSVNGVVEGIDSASDNSVESSLERIELAELASLLTTQRLSQNSAFLETDSNKILDKLDYHGITVLAHNSAKLPPALSSELKHRQAMMVANEVLKKQALVALFSGFRDAGLDRIVLFKGSALAYSSYAEPWHRPRSDSDCLIDVSQLEQFVSVFEQQGYQKLFAIEGEHIHYQATYSKALAGNSAINIDLHWQISNRKILSATFAVDELLRDGRCATALHPQIMIPSLEDCLLISSLHRLGHHIHEERLVWLYDIHLLSCEMDSAGWETLSHKAIEKQLCAITLDALQFCESLFDTRVPAEVLSALKKGAETKEPSKLFLNRNLSEWHYFWQDLRALSGVRNKLVAVWENLVPPPAYVRQQMETPYATWGYLKRTVRGLKRLANS